tara:strand:- start:373 stop:1182 length:810 start_codon:yes stop_codon:yes gene_type:complete
MRKNNQERFSFPDAPSTQMGYSVPTDFVELPSKGKFYPEEHPFYNKEEVEVKFMTTKEEDILMSPSYNKKGIVFDRLIDSILVDRVKVDSLLLGDKNAILLNARKNAYGSEYEVSLVCKQCYYEQKLVIDLDEVGIKSKALEDIEFTEKGTFVIRTPRTKKTVELKLLTAKDEEEIIEKIEQKTKHNLPEAVVTDRLRQIIVSVEGSTDILVISEFVSSLPIFDSKYIQKKYVQATPDVDFVYENTCEECGHINKGGVPINEGFFWPDG